MPIYASRVIPHEHDLPPVYKNTLQPGKVHNLEALLKAISPHTLAFLREGYERGLIPDDLTKANLLEKMHKKPKGWFDGQLREQRARFERDATALEQRAFGVQPIGVVVE